MKIQWDSKYSVHVSELDAQHKHLIELVTSLEKASQTADFKSSLKTVFDELMEYVMIHFHTEEAYMESVQYVGLEAHRKLHEALAQEVNDRINDIMSREPSALDLVKLHNFLVNWVNDHILEEDQQYVEALKAVHDL